MQKQRLKSIFLAALVFFWMDVSGQSSDSDQLTQVKKMMGRKQLDSAEVLSWILINTSHDSLIVGQSFNNLGVMEMKRGAYPKAIGLMERALNNYPVAGAERYKAGSNYNLGMIYKDLGEFKIASEYLYAAAKYSDGVDDKNLCKVLNVLGNLHREMGDYRVSEEFFEQALDLSHAIAIPELEAQVLNNQGQLYLEMDYMDLALSSLNSSLELKVELSDSSHMASTFFNLGKAFYRLRSYEKSELYFEESHRLRLRQGDSLDVADCLNWLAKTDIQLSRFDAASQALNESFRIASALNGESVLLENFEVRKEFAVQRNDLKDALTWSERYLEQYEKVADKAKRQAIQGLNELHKVNALRNDYDQLTQRSALQELQLENERRQSQLLKTVVVSIGVICLLLILFMRQLRARNRKIKKQKAHIENLRTELDHRTKNNFQELLGLLDHRSKGVSDEEALRVLEEVTNQVNVMNLIHKSLSSEEGGGVTSNLTAFDQSLHQLAESLILVYRSRGEVILDMQLDNIVLQKEKAMTLGLIANEILSNALKYGMDKQHPKLSIRLEHQNDGIVLMQIGDNGSGLGTAPVRKGTGTALIAGLAKQLQAEMRVEENPGLTYTLIFKA